MLRAESQTGLRARLRTSTVWHEPLPLERAQIASRSHGSFRAALDSAGVKAAFVDAPAEAGVAGRVLLAPRHALLVLVNERADAATRKLLVDGHAVEMRVAAEGSSLAIVERATGKTIVASSAPAVTLSPARP